MTLEPPRGEGNWVRLADGSDWRLPDPATLRNDPVIGDLLAAFGEAEDLADARRAGLALTIHLLRREGITTPQALAARLSFGPDQATLERLQEAIDALAFRALELDRPAPVARESGWWVFRRLASLWRRASPRAYWRAAPFRRDRGTA